MSAMAFSKEEVLVIHAAAIERFGGLAGLRDEGLLEYPPGSTRFDPILRVWTRARRVQQRGHTRGLLGLHARRCRSRI